MNGTNYIRNTRLELWFLRRLASKQQLRRYRDAVVTAGINDVGPNQGLDGAIQSVQALLGDLASAAYDDRIPRMVAGYFRDMEMVFAGLRHQMSAGSVLCLDIGDSRYAGIHIPTQDVLVELGT